MKTTNALAMTLGLALLVGCGGGHHAAPPAPAKEMAYTDPAPSASDWRLVKDASSTETHLVLNLMGPSDGSKYRGVGFTLQADTTKVKFVQFQNAYGRPLGYFQDGGVLRDRYPMNMAPTLRAGGVKDDRLMVGIFQKTDDGLFGSEAGATAKDCNAVVLQVALEFDPTAKVMPGDVSLAVTKARVIPEQIDTLATRRMQDVNLKLGMLALK